MSSRAIRKLQKLREQENQQPPTLEQDDRGEDHGDEKPQLNAFDILGAGDDGDEEENDEEEAEEESAEVRPSEPVTNPAESDMKKKKKKKKKKKAKDKEQQPPAVELDEIDRALKELSTGEETHQYNAHNPATAPATSFAKAPEELLSIDPRYLNATNEMRKLFGNVVLETFEGEDATSGRRRGQRREEMVDLGTALTGPYSPASRGQSFSGVTLRRNALMPAKDEWPRAPSGGLGMIVEENLPNGNTVYRIIHNTAYKDVQMQFDMCVESMDPQRLIYLLQYNPYHISTLLQVSEIAKHQGDHAVSADLLERALFNIGRSAHSTFGKRLREGRANFNFIYMENRELWLVGWRYIANLGMKGTWRTAYEWAKLLLSLDTKDPYCMKLVIDHLALRGREYMHFMELCTQTQFRQDWEPFPNIQCSLVLAYLRLNRPKESRRQLHLAMSRYPWIFSRLAQELDITPIPPRIWGKMPPNEGHELFTELYVTRAKDLWNTPEVVGLVVEVADTLGDEEPAVMESPPITQDVARHVIVSDIPRVTAHLPPQFTAGRISASDPLPPYGSEAFRQQSDPAPAYLTQLPAGRPQWLRNILAQMIPVHPSEEEEEDDDDHSSTEEHEGEAQHPRNFHGHLDNDLEQWLLGPGLQQLEDFLALNGVDRGNWGDDVDLFPLLGYVDALGHIESEERQGILHGAIRDAVGDIGVSVLEDELELMDYDSSEE